MMKLASGHEVTYPPEHIQKEQKEDFEGYGNGVIKLVPGDWFYTKSFIKYADAYYNFKFKPTDVVIMTFPKCGTTWMTEIVWTMRNNPDLNNPISNIPIMSKVPFLELDFIMDSPNISTPPPDSMLIKYFEKNCPGKDPRDGIFLPLSNVSPDPRTIKTHLSFPLLPPNMLDTCKVIFYVRNPKDACVSFHHHSKIFKSHTYKNSFDQFVKHYLDDNVLYGPYWNYMKEGWERRSHPNLHFCYYEDHKADPTKGIQELNEFLGTNLTDDQINNVVKHTSFQSMKERDNLMGSKKEQELYMVADMVEKEGGFFRKGESGDFKSKLSPEQDVKFDEWTKKHCEDFGKDFKYAQKY